VSQSKWALPPGTSRGSTYRGREGEGSGLRSIGGQARLGLDDTRPERDLRGGSTRRPSPFAPLSSSAIDLEGPWVAPKAMGRAGAPRADSRQALVRKDREQDGEDLRLLLHSTEGHTLGPVGPGLTVVCMGSRASR
jgi:hypothetical protein